jgi:peptide chain release factor 1
VLTARIQEKERSERAAKDAAMRKGLIGSGDRSDRIRTYNYPQGRWTMGEGLLALRHAREAELLADLENA